MIVGLAQNDINSYKMSDLFKLSNDCLKSDYKSSSRFNSSKEK